MGDRSYERCDRSFTTHLPFSLNFSHSAGAYFRQHIRLSLVYANTRSLMLLGTLVLLAGVAIG